MKAKKKMKAAVAAAIIDGGSPLRLPPRSAPVSRGRSTAPFRAHVAAAQQDCAACLTACARLPSPLRAFCESLCREVCRG